MLVANTLLQRIAIGRCCILRLAPLTFIAHVWFNNTNIIAYMLDSLVRVSRRVGRKISQFSKNTRSPSTSPATNAYWVMPKLWPSRVYDAGEADLAFWQGANSQLRQPRTAPYGNRNATDRTLLCQLQAKWKLPIASTSTVSGLFNSLLFIQSSYV